MSSSIDDAYESSSGETLLLMRRVAGNIHEYLQIFNFCANIFNVISHSQVLFLVAEKANISLDEAFLISSWKPALSPTALNKLVIV